MPFIRYNTEDIGVLIDVDCNCGSQFPLMEVTEGRASDTIFLKDGRTVPAHEVCVRLYSVEGIKQFQIIQEDLSSFTIKIVKNSKFTEKLNENIVQALEQKIGKVKLELLVVDEIPRLKSGKFKQFLTKIRKL